MSMLRRGSSRRAPDRDRPEPRFVNRRTKSWPCPSPAHFSILRMYDRHDIVLQVSGELGGEAAPAFAACAAASIEDHPRRLVVEMSALETMNDTGMRAVIAARDRATDAEVDFVLDAPSAQTSAILDAAGVLESFSIRAAA